MKTQLLLNLAAALGMSLASGGVALASARVASDAVVVQTHGSSTPPIFIGNPSAGRR